MYLVYNSSFVTFKTKQASINNKKLIKNFKYLMNNSKEKKVANLYI